MKMNTNKNFSSNILRYAKKYKAIELLGGECKKCGEKRFFRLSFHHESDKEYTMNFLNPKKWNVIEKEIQKCILLCHNCHSELHHINNKETEYRKNKKLYLEYKNVGGCKECGYDKCNESLTFHHNYDKNIKISKCRNGKLDKIKESIIEELNKCEVLCQNCHTEKHSNLEFFNKNLNLIIEKSKNLRYRSNNINKEIVKEMYLNGINQKEIVKHFNCSKGTISGIIKELNINREYRVDEYEVEKLYNEGLSPVEITKKLNLNSRTTIYKVIKRIKNKYMAP